MKPLNLKGPVVDKIEFDFYYTEARRRTNYVGLKATKDLRLRPTNLTFIKTDSVIISQVIFTDDDDDDDNDDL